MMPEFSVPIRLQDIGSAVRQHRIVADTGARAGLVRRFALLDLASLEAVVDVQREAAGIRVAGQLSAAGEQPCVTTGEPVPFVLVEAIDLLLTEAAPEGDDIELADTDLDTEPLVGDSIDLGEIAAQALALALDPYPRSPSPAAGVISEEQARAASNPFSVLKKD